MCYSHTLCPYLSLNNYIITILNNGLTFNFFFQAEDGIRDHCVTGAQTCALPICRASAAPALPGRPNGAGGPWQRRRRPSPALAGARRLTGRWLRPGERDLRTVRRLPGPGTARSEERRVWKESRAWERERHENEGG